MSTAGLTRGASISLAIRVAGVGLLFAAHLVLARAISQSDYGLFAYLVELVALCAVLASWGFDQIALKVVPDSYANGQRRNFLRFVSAGTVMVMVSALILTGLLWIARAVGATPPQMSVGLLLLTVAALSALGLLRLMQEAIRSLRRIAASQIVEQLAWPAALLAIGGAMMLARPEQPVFWLVGMQAAVSLFGAVLLGTRVLSIFGPSRSDAAEGVGGWLADSVPLAAAAGFSLILNRGDVLALGAVLSTEDIAPYAAASRYAALLVLGLAAASAASAGAMRDSWRSRDIEQLQQAVSHAAGLAAMIALPAAILLIAFPGVFLGLYGPGFVAGSTPLIILVAAQLLNALTGPVALVVIVCDLGAQYSMAMIMAAAIMAGLLLVLVPLWGTVGAALALLVSLSVLNIWLSVLIYRATGVRCWVTPATLVAAFGELGAIARRLLAAGRKAA